MSDTGWVRPSLILRLASIHCVIGKRSWSDQRLGYSCLQSLRPSLRMSSGKEFPSVDLLHRPISFVHSLLLSIAGSQEYVEYHAYSFSVELS